MLPPSPSLVRSLYLAASLWGRYGVNARVATPGVWHLNFKARTNPTLNLWSHSIRAVSSPRQP